MYVINLMDRSTGKLVVEGYASFDSDVEALDFARKHEMSFRRCGWYSVINWI